MRQLITLAATVILSACVMTVNEGEPPQYHWAGDYEAQENAVYGETEQNLYNLVRKRFEAEQLNPKWVSEVDDNTVTLKGKVDSVEMVQKAIMVASETEGVVEVVSYLSVAVSKK